MFQILAHRTNREAIFFRLFFFENIIKIHFSRLHDKYLDFIAPLCLVIFDSFCVLLSPLPVLLSPAKRKLTNSPTDDAQQQLRIRAERWSLLIKQHEMRKKSSSSSLLPRFSRELLAPMPLLWWERHRYSQTLKRRKKEDLTSRARKVFKYSALRGLHT